jgi:hypothetical protein
LAALKTLAKHNIEPSKRFRRRLARRIISHLLQIDNKRRTSFPGNLMLKDTAPHAATQSTHNATLSYFENTP